MATKLLNIEAGGRQRIDRYELIGEIASGGMATVYLARLTGVGGFQRFFALKRLHPHLAGEKEFVEMFLDEARLAAGIHHPNVVPILEVGASPSGYYLVMEYIEGETLARLLARAAARGSRLPPPVAIRAGLDMLQGLHAAHELRDDTGELVGLVHRDVSPQNVLVGSDGITRITDFGVARAASRLTATRVGQLKGKIAYMAPEQAAGLEDLDRRADVFACGIVLWEALAQRRLFKAENEAATLSRVMNEPIPSLQQAAPHLPVAMTQVIMKALERDPEGRFATCADLADALEAVAIESGNLASPREMQAYMQEVLGEEIQKQRDAVRNWIAKSDSAPRPDVLGSSSVSSASVSLPGSEPNASSVSSVGRGGSGRVPRFVGLGALALLGAVGFLAYKRLGSPELVPATGGVSAAEPELVDLDPVATASAARPEPETGEPGPGQASDESTESPAAAPQDQPDSEASRAADPKKKATEPLPPPAHGSGAPPSSGSEPRPTQSEPKPPPKSDPKPAPSKKKDPFDGLSQNPYR